MKEGNIIQEDAEIDKERKNLRNKISVVREKIKCDDKELRNGINTYMRECHFLPTGYSTSKRFAQTRWL